MSGYCSLLLKRSTLFLVALFTGFSSGAAQEIQYSGGAGYSTGSYYFNEQTSTFHLSNGLSAGFKRVRLSVNVPFIVQSTPWISYTLQGGIPTGGSQNGSLKKQGGGQGMGPGGGSQREVVLPDTVSYTKASFSDPSIQIGLKLFSGAQTQSTITLNGYLKVPLTDPSTGYGTGAWDTGTGVSVSQGVGYSWMLFADATWWWLGNMDDLTLNNTLAFSVGMGKILTGTSWIVNAALSGFTTVIDNYDPPLSIMAGSGYKVNDRVFLNLSLEVGLSESSPDVSTSVGWSVIL